MEWGRISRLVYGNCKNSHEVGKQRLGEDGTSDADLEDEALGRKNDKLGKKKQKNLAAAMG
ncbi:MAG: hypothetical protein ACREVX_00800 [Clostridium sp.]|uniref:hypothetical protein n=1 Tax=Clostridium sp. TaxID=1506 RepID=UPI003D6D728C